MQKFVSFNGLDWYLNKTHGKIIGKNERDFTLYEFFVANPPAVDSKEHPLFVAVCEMAVAQGLLRRSHIYWTVQK